MRARLRFARRLVPGSAARGRPAGVVAGAGSGAATGATGAGAGAAGVGEGVGVAVLAGVGLGVAVLTGVGLGVGVFAGVGLGVAVFAGVGLGVGVLVGVGVGVGAAATPAVAFDAFQSRSSPRYAYSTTRMRLPRSALLSVYVVSSAWSIGAQLYSERSSLQRIHKRPTVVPHGPPARPPTAVSLEPTCNVPVMVGASETYGR
ncbi:MAG TPA: hypothetical protein VFG79_04555 [Solirubrobacter sp.]|nr:hypothetical protein [Solirubrobacter sp.]